MRPRVIVSLALALVACGARAGLDGPLPAATLPDGGQPVPAVLPCAGTSAVGAIAWQTPLGQPEERVRGPVAADDAGTTYFFVARATNPTDYTLVALDSCGRVLWRTDPVAAPTLNAPSSFLVRGDQLVAQWGGVDGFDRATGKHLWNVDLDALAGENLGLDDFSSIGPVIAAKDGTAYLAFETGATAALIAIDKAGHTTALATTPNEGSIVSLVLDGAGHLDVLFNTALRGALVKSFTTAGATVFSASFVCQSGFLGELASSSKYLVMQTGPCVLSLGGDTGLWPPPVGADTVDYDGIVIDGADNAYAKDSAGDVFSFDGAGQKRWKLPVGKALVAGPLLATGDQVLVVASEAPSPPAMVVTIDAKTGASLSTRTVGAFEGTDALLTAAQHLVFVGGNVATAVAMGQVPAPDAQWSTVNGGADQRRAAGGR
jgi:outer membrane protein assembly factor BamB